MLQIGLQKLDVASICEAYVFALANLFPVPVGTAKCVEQRATKVCCVGDICNFVKLIRNIDRDQIAQPRERDVGVLLVNGEFAQRFSV